jgi:hypothetical protein
MSDTYPTKITWLLILHSLVMCLGIVIYLVGFFVGNKWCAYSGFPLIIGALVIQRWEHRVEDRFYQRINSENECTVT